MVGDQLGRMEQDMREVILLQLQSRVITLLALNHLDRFGNDVRFRGQTGHGAKQPPSTQAVSQAP
jgi:hypothetical protein